MNQTAINISKHAQQGAAGSCPRAADYVCGNVWSSVSTAFDMLRTHLVTIQGDPGSSG